MLIFCSQKKVETVKTNVIVFKILSNSIAVFNINFVLRFKNFDQKFMKWHFFNKSPSNNQGKNTYLFHLNSRKKVLENNENSGKLMEN